MILVCYNIVYQYFFMNYLIMIFIIQINAHLLVLLNVILFMMYVHLYVHLLLIYVNLYYHND